MEIQQILKATSLPELSSADPELWQMVFRDIKERVSSGQTATLGPLRMTQVKVLEKWLGGSESPLASSQHAYQSVLKARMTVLAIDQFADAMTGKIGAPPSFRDRLVFATTVGRMLQNQQLLGCNDFDRNWSWIKDKIWAAAEIQRRGYWSVPTKEFVHRVKDHAAGRSVLEVGAGLGYLSSALQKSGVDVKACDDMSWQQSASTFTKSPVVETLDAISALKTRRPSVVICSWPPPGNYFEETIFQTSSVQIYIAIVSQHRFASGNWLAYQRQSQFICTTSAPLNDLLRPLEAEQQALIFRRR